MVGVQQTLSQLGSIGQQWSLSWIICILSSEHLLYSPLRFWSPTPPHTPPLPMTEFPSVRKLVLFHGSLLEAKVPISNYLPFIFLYLLPYLMLWRFSASIQRLFCKSCSTCRCIFYVIVGRKVISPSYSSIVCSCLLCHRLIFHVSVDSYLHFLFCSIDPCIYLCVCVDHTISLL